MRQKGRDPFDDWKLIQGELTRNAIPFGAVGHGELLLGQHHQPPVEPHDRRAVLRTQPHLGKTEKERYGSGDFGPAPERRHSLASGCSSPNPDPRGLL